MFDTVLEILKKQRMAWSWAVIVGLFLILLGHAPVLPVIAGCALAIAISMLRSVPRSQVRPVRARGGR
jgi:hypothetical protein